MKKRLLSLLLAVLFVLPLAVPAHAENVNDYKVIASTFNADAVSNCAEGLPRYNLNDGTNVLLQAVTTYHYNGGKGAKPGTIKIYDEYGGKETLLGTWNAVGRDGNKYWDIFPNIVMKDRHKYTFEPSDTSTWSSNAAANYMGFIELRGIKPYQGTTPPATNSNTGSKLNVVRSPQKLSVNGKNQTTEINNIDGTNYFKLRDLAAMLNGTDSQFNVDYDASRNMIVVKTGVPYTTATGQELRVGADNSASTVKSSQSMTIDGKTVNLTAYNIGGTNFFGLRDLSAYMGYQVDYDAKTNTAIVATSDGGSGGNNTTANVTLTLSKSVFAPGDTVTVKYSGVTQQMISSGAWIGMAGANNAAGEHLNSVNYVKSESGSVTLKAPSGAGSYQVRFYQGQGASDSTLLRSASASFTVVVKTDEVPDPDFDEYLLITNSFHNMEDGHKVFVEAHGTEVTFDFPSEDWHCIVDDSENEGPFIEALDLNYRRSAVKLSGTITSKKSATDSSGRKYYLYEGTIDGFYSSSTQIARESGVSATVRPNECVVYRDSKIWDVYTSTQTFSEPSDGARFSLRVYEDGHRQAFVRPAGNGTEESRRYVLDVGSNIPYWKDATESFSNALMFEAMLVERGSYRD